MSTYKQLLIQIVFGAKYRVKFLNRSNQEFVYNYMAGICRNNRVVPYAIGGYVDHIHMVLDFHPAISISSFVKEVKTSTSSMMKSNKSIFQNFNSWQVGYGVFAYSMDSKDNLIRYVKNQENHHKGKDFLEELIEIYDDYGIKYEEKYLLV